MPLSTLLTVRQQQASHRKHIYATFAYSSVNAPAMYLTVTAVLEVNYLQHQGLASVLLIVSVAVNQKVEQVNIFRPIKLGDSLEGKRKRERERITIERDWERELKERWTFRCNCETAVYVLGVLKALSEAGESLGNFSLLLCWNKLYKSVSDTFQPYFTKTDMKKEVIKNLFQPMNICLALKVV